MADKILIIQTASIGDVILITPVIEKLHLFFPESQIDIMIKKGYEGLFVEHPILNKVLLWDKSQHKYNKLIQLLKQIRSEKYDLVINVQRFASTGLLTVLSGAAKTIGFDKNPFSRFFTTRIRHDIGLKDHFIHEVDRNLKLIEPLTNAESERPKLYPTKKNLITTAKYKLQKYICIAPASLWFTKQYPEDQWIDFVSKIDSSFMIYLLGSKSDNDLCERIKKLSNHCNVINLAGKLNLLESTALMQDAAMNFVNDSAPMHLCSAVNAKTTVMYCSTIPEFGFGPLSDDAVIIQTNEKLDCRPCGLHGFKQCPELHFKCATTLSTNALLNRL
ncbi:MAG: glycosyltransferase family 9 protein [Bacteroidales bacterium]|nr:glycosyltransferase family 9 protein [Bacteroidales bacterium]